MRDRRPEFDRFIEKVDKTDTCWNWTGTTYRRGYGHFGRHLDGKFKMYKCHRYSYEYFKGPIPEGLLVLHTCDNPACVNPDHLFLGTHQDNTDDMMDKGRWGYPRNNSHKHLSLDIAKQVRQFKLDNPKMKQTLISEHFNVSTAQISRILNNLIWSE